MEKFHIQALMEGIDGAWISSWIHLFLFSKSACSHLFFFFNTEWSTSLVTKVLLEENNLTFSVPCPELNINFKLGDLYTK